jgi:hypothetical protein
MEQERQKRMRKIFFFASFVLFIAINIPFFAMFFDDFRYSGAYCNPIGQNDPYDFEYPLGRKCDFNFPALEEPIGIFLLAHTIFQAPLWAVYGGIRFVTRLLSVHPERS